MGKYNYLNPDPFSMHAKIIKCIDENNKILDVGCAEGNIAEVLSSNKCDVVGIEIDQKSAQNAQNYCKEVILGDVESLELSSEYNNYFDYILFADILEHLKDPLIVLKKFKKYLKNDGYIIVSLPNISNWRMRIKILFGNFEYENTGLLDKGHIRFFNKKSAENLIKDAGFEITKFDITGLDSPFGTKFFQLIGNQFPNLLAYQFLIIAKKTNYNKKI
ncbi:MAG: class I SAM-dependent methyltransferase [Methanobacterium sp.]